MSTQEFIARVHEEEGSFWAEVIDLPGCFASGDSLDELRDALEEAISLYRQDESDTRKIEDLGQPTTRRLEIGEIRVKVPA
jgi:predicted RNase H-like HicB family nuclease